jgi:hypothetical protein
MAGATWEEQWKEARFESPARQPTPAGDVIVPFYQAAISGGVVAVLGIGVGIVATVNNGWPWYVPLEVGAVVGVAALSVAWFVLLKDHRQLLRRVESYSGAVEETPQAHPQPRQDRVQVEVTDVDRRPVETIGPKDAPSVAIGGGARGRTMAMYEIPTGIEQLKAIFMATDGPGARHFTRRELGPKGARIMSEDGLEAVFKAMVNAGFLRWRNGNRNHPDGPEITPSGRAFRRSLLGDTSPTHSTPPLHSPLESAE